jgi:SAM-dependent methyltransferase
VVTRALSGPSLERGLGWLRLVAAERLGRRTLARVPEPAAVMAEPERVAAFDDAGVHASSLEPVYEFDVACCSRLVPRGGSVLDLGCGSGRCAARLALARPDITVVGIDLSAAMLARGRRTLRRLGLDDRVRLEEGDMREFVGAQRGATFSLVHSLFSMHHLATADDLARCTAELGRARRRWGSALWVFDHARPRRSSTCEVFPWLAMPTAAPALLIDSRDSLRAAWTPGELRRALRSGVGQPLHAATSRLVPLYQAYWIAGPDQQRHAPPTTPGSRHSIAFARLFDPGALPL